ncbi:hypothetical protein GLAREA_00616 [Glarea lozoyensis ATCC 20868]|uniref:Uncharacterized protein n=1 Tax=Glarea lozoyensis (strain ATCC 20868 / MF5171) TaxID=1116229 RepID=S3DBV3_GLAL2|nr:uncharacterized protein GLAREA_00616 [Glarea lozoyensis ATCC 20868]EPE29456.1 hypothetical protein GLAREA_00616 [Glarea lozoyensis ATCC 20868]
MNPTEPSSFEAAAAAEAPISPTSPHSFTLDSLREQTITRPEHRRSNSSSSTVTVIYSPLPSPCHQQSIATAQAPSNSQPPESDHLRPPIFTSNKDLAINTPSQLDSTQDFPDLQRYQDIDKENANVTAASFRGPQPSLSNIGEASPVQELQFFGPYTVPVRRRARAYSEKFPEFPTKSSSPVDSVAITPANSQPNISSIISTPRAHLRSISNGSAFASTGSLSSPPPVTQVRTRGRARSTTLTSCVNPLDEPITAEEQAISNLAQAINRQNRREAAFSNPIHNNSITRAGTWSGGDQARRSTLQYPSRGTIAFKSPPLSRSPEPASSRSPEPFPVLVELPERSYKGSLDQIQ